MSTMEPNMPLSPRGRIIVSMWEHLRGLGIVVIDFRLRGGCWEAELSRKRGWVRVSDLLESRALADLDGEPHLCAQLS